MTVQAEGSGDLFLSAELISFLLGGTPTEKLRVESDGTFKVGGPVTALTTDADLQLTANGTGLIAATGPFRVATGAVVPTPAPGASLQFTYDDNLSSDQAELSSYHGGDGLPTPTVTPHYTDMNLRGNELNFSTGSLVTGTALVPNQERMRLDGTGDLLLWKNATPQITLNGENLSSDMLLKFQYGDPDGTPNHRATIWYCGNVDSLFFTDRSNDNWLQYKDGTDDKLTLGDDLFVLDLDSDDARVGVGTATPSAPFHVTVSSLFDSAVDINAAADISSNLAVGGTLEVGSDATFEGDVLILPSSGDAELKAGGSAGFTLTHTSGPVGLMDIDLASDAVAVGESASASTTSASAFGKSAAASGIGGSAIGADAEASAVASSAVGAAAVASGSSSVALGYDTDATSSSSIAIGSQAQSTDLFTLAIGSSASSSHDDGIAIGHTASVGADNGIAIGEDATVAGTHARSIAIGQEAATTAANQMVVGSAGTNITDIYLGGGVVSTSPDAVTVNSAGGSGSNIAGANLNLAGGKGTGSGAGGNVVIRTAPGDAGTATDLNDLETAVVIDDDKNLIVGGGSSNGGAAGAVIIGEGTKPASGVASSAGLFAKDNGGTSELYAFDENGNETILSPHGFDLFTPAAGLPSPWEYSSRNEYLGIAIGVDMAQAIEDLQGVTGKTYIHTQSITSRDWYADQVARKAAVEAQRTEDAINSTWVEIDISEAVEVVAETETEETVTEVAEWVFDSATGSVTQVVREVTVRSQVPTGNSVYAIKDGVRMDKATGKFFRRPMATEVEIEPYEIKDPPAWMAERMFQ